MRTDFQLLQSALAVGDLRKEDVSKITRDKARTINLYSVKMPEKFKGLPSVWFFGILQEQSRIEDNVEVIMDEADGLIRQLLKDKGVPIVFISNYHFIHFGDTLGYGEQPVFFLKSTDLPGKDSLAKGAKSVQDDAPVLLAIKRQFKASQPSYYLSPYLPNKPVSDWRFFGRKKEIAEIMESETNCFVIGARRMGKTSLLQEIERQLHNRGEAVYRIECQYMTRIQEVVYQMLEKLSYRDFVQIQNMGKTVELDYIRTVIRKLKKENKSITLIFDELGNVISKDIYNNSWRFIGVLRELSHNGEAKVIASAFQEVIIRQLYNSEGPFVNFGNTITIGPFAKSEVEELLISPLNFWGKIKDKKDFSNKVKRYIGSHPLLLQYLGKRLFEKLMNNSEVNIDDIVEIIYQDELDYFRSAVDDLYIDGIESCLEKYVFLRFCIDIEKSGQELVVADINQQVLKTLLEELNIESDFDTRRLFLHRLSLRGLLSQDLSNKLTYRIASPLIYNYLKAFYAPVEQLGEIYKGDIKIVKLTVNEF